MTQYDSLNVRLSTLQINKLKSVIKNGTKVTLKLSSNVDGENNDDISFWPKFLLTDTQLSKLRKAVANGSSANIKLSKAQVNKTGQSGGFLGRLLGPLLKTGFPLIKNVFKPLAKSVLIPLGLTATASLTDAAIH